MGWIEGFDTLNVDFVIAHDLYLSAKLAKVLVKVISERIVVIDDQQHNVSAAPIRFGKA